MGVLYLPLLLIVVVVTLPRILLYVVIFGIDHEIGTSANHRLFDGQILKEIGAAEIADMISEILDLLFRVIELALHR